MINANAQQVATARRQAETAEIKAELELLDEHKGLFSTDELSRLKKQKLMQIFSCKTFQECLDASQNNNVLHEMNSAADENSPTNN